MQLTSIDESATTVSDDLTSDGSGHTVYHEGIDETMLETIKIEKLTSERLMLHDASITVDRSGLGKV